VQDSKQGDALRAEIKEICRKENLMHPDEWKVDFWEQPTSHLLSVFKTYASMEFDLWATVRHFLLVLLVLLLVPALNLSGMISSRMEGRLAEMGVRKSFGAGRKILLSQVMWENLLLTALGGALGLLLAWLALYVGREWIFTVSTAGRIWYPKEWRSAYRVRCCLLRWFFSQHWCCVSY